MIHYSLILLIIRKFLCYYLNKYYGIRLFVSSHLAIFRQISDFKNINRDTHEINWKYKDFFYTSLPIYLIIATFAQVTIPSLVLTSRNVQAKHKMHSPLQEV